MTDLATQTTPQETSGETPSQTTTPQMPFETPSTQPPESTTPQVEVEAPTFESATTPAPPTETNIPTTEEIDALREKARQFDQLDSNPEVVQIISDYYKDRGTDVPTAEPVTQPEGISPELRKELDGLRNLNQQLHAQMQIQQFGVTHPDFPKYKEAMGREITKHLTLGLDEAYDYVKLLEAQQAGSGVPRTAPQVPEGHQNSPVNTSTEPNLSDIEARIRDPKATKSIEEATRLAWQAATAQHEASN